MQSIKVKVLTVFMSLIMVVTMLPALKSNADTNTWKDNGITYQLNDSTGVFTVTGNGPMFDFGMDASHKSNAPWYSKRYSIKTVVIGAGITRVGNNSFVGCSNLKEIVFQSTGNLKTIGVQAFYECYTLPRVVFPKGLTTIGTNAFAFDTALAAVSFPSTLRTIAYGAFARCGLRSVVIPAGCTTIGDFAFKSNHSLVSVTGGANLVTIGKQAFEFTSKLKTFKIASKKLSRIGSCCFYCSSLKTLQIKKTTKLKKKKVKGSLYLSSVKTVKVKKSKVRKYRKFFTYRNCGKRRVKVKK